MIIAIDGPAGAGKSTVCRLLAQRLGFLYLDTGAMYRALAWAFLQEGGVPAEEEIAGSLTRLPLCFSISRSSLKISYGAKELAEELRSPEISDESSRISRLEPVRAFLLSWQRELARQGDIVAEGRDTATVVFPGADLKVFLTADLPTRMERRRSEYLLKGIEIAREEMEKQIRERDEADANRALAPLKPAEGALVLDTSSMEINQVVERLVNEVQKRRTG